MLSFPTGHYGTHNSFNLLEHNDSNYWNPFQKRQDEFSVQIVSFSVDVTHAFPSMHYATIEF